MEKGTPRKKGTITFSSDELESNDQIVNLLIRLLRHRRENEPCFMLGDLNMRIAEFTGDHTTNARGRMHRNLLFEDADVSYCKNDAGPEGQTYTFRGDDLGISIIDYIFISRNVRRVKSWKLYILREEEYREKMQSNFKDVHAPSLNVLLDGYTISSQQDCDRLNEVVTEAFKKNADQVIGRTVGFGGGSQRPQRG